MYQWIPQQFAVVAINFLFFATLSAWSQKFVINEVYPAPRGDEPEWIELYNLENRTRVLTNGWINDLSRSIALPPIRIPAKGFAILCRDTLALQMFWPIPPTAVLIETALPSLNNSGDMLALRNQDSLLLDSIIYRSRWGKKGKSLERILPEQPATSSQQWKASESFYNATPGWLNSVTPVSIDWRILALRVDGLNHQLRLLLHNNGKTALSMAEAAVFWDQNQNAHIDPGEQIAHQTFTAIPLGDTIQWTITIESLPTNWQPIIIVLKAANDQRPTNDSLYSMIYRSHPPRSLLFNEILYEPENNCGEFIEIWNAALDSVELGGYRLYDRSDRGVTDTVVLPPFRLAPRQLAVIVWDTLCFFERFPELRHHPAVLQVPKILTLNNTGDVLVLRDPNLLLQDSVAYSPAWHIDAVASTRNRSLEKLTPSLPSADPTSWTTCGALAGSTPLQPNSISIIPSSRGQLTITPNPFVPRKDDPRSGSVITYELPFTQALITVTLYDPNGLLVRNLVTGFYTAANGALFWNGTDQNGQILPPGPYICVFEATALDRSEYFRCHRVIVLGPP